MNKYKLFESIPSFHLWRKDALSGKDAIENYISFNFKIAHLIMTIDLIDPKFIEKDNMVLRIKNLPENIDDYLNDLKEKQAWSPRQIEYAVNHLHLEDYFFNDEDLKDYPANVIEELATFIAKIWENKLKTDFPEKRFKVGTDFSTGWEVYSYQI